jgi:hypothetical protein
MQRGWKKPGNRGGNAENGPSLEGRIFYLEQLEATSHQLSAFSFQLPA